MKVRRDVASRAATREAGHEAAGQFSIAISSLRDAFLLLLVFGFLLAGCSTLRLGYNNADTLTLAYLDYYLDLDKEQRELARNGLREIFAWHRSQELPRYVKQLGLMEQALDREVGAADVEQLQDFTRDTIDRTLAHAAPHIVALARTLRPEQMAYLQKRFDKANKDFRAEYLDGSEQERQDRRLKRLVDQMERWFGGFSARQTKAMREWMLALPVDSQARYEERLRRQRELIELLETLRDKRLSVSQAHKELLDYATRFETKHPEDVRIEGLDLIATIVNHTTKAQKKTAHERMRGWAEDFGTLIATGP